MIRSISFWQYYFMNVYESKQSGSYQFWNKIELKQHGFVVKMHILNGFVSKQYTNILQVLKLFTNIYSLVFHTLCLQINILVFFTHFFYKYIFSCFSHTLFKNIYSRVFHTLCLQIYILVFFTHSIYKCIFSCFSHTLFTNIYSRVFHILLSRMCSDKWLLWKFCEYSKCFLKNFGIS